ncbi:MAG: peptide deformylase [bacterium P3]|nr:MAG: peptide deformylase [bacterium P3]KWW42168.1 MAG: peptide deformylase [bacterium F083]
MILPIVGYGHPTLRKTAKPIDSDYPNLKQLVSDMFETMYAADGVGLAAPQVDLSIQVVVIGVPVYDEQSKSYGDELEEHVMVNPEIIESKGQMRYYNEGCLSLPGIHEDVLRPERVVVRYFDTDFNEHVEEIDGMYARIAQHEIDHLQGKVFTDRLTPLRKAMVKRRLTEVASGRVQAAYKMQPVKKTVK